jgi:hypothetical protein
MNRENKPEPNLQESHRREHYSSVPADEPLLYLTVIRTTHEGTAAALEAAIGLSGELNASIAVLTIKSVPSHFRPEQTSISLDSSEMQELLPVLGPRAQAVEVVERIRHCRNLDGDLQQVFRRRALVVIGGKRRWWKSGEERLEKALRRLGHHVIFIEADRGGDWRSRQDLLLPRGSKASQLHKQACRSERPS